MILIYMYIVMFFFFCSIWDRYVGGILKGVFSLMDIWKKNGVVKVIGGYL